MSFRRLGLRGPLLFGLGLLAAACASATGTGEEGDPPGRPEPTAGGAGVLGKGGSGGKAASAGKAGSVGAVALGGESGAGGQSEQAGFAGAPSGTGGGAGAGASGAAGTSLGISGAAGTSGAGNGASAGSAGGGGISAGTGGQAGASAGKAGAGGSSGGAGASAGSAGSSGGGGISGRAGAGGGSGSGGGGAGTGGTSGSGGSAGQGGAAGAGGGGVPVVCHDPCVAGPPMDASCGVAVVGAACDPAQSGDNSCCTTAWSDACVAFTDAVVGCANRSPGYQACVDYRKWSAPADQTACDQCESGCFGLSDCGSFPADLDLGVGCDPPFGFRSAAKVCGCLVTPKIGSGEGCMHVADAACCLSQGAIYRCLVAQCKTACAP